MVRKRNNLAKKVVIPLVMDKKQHNDWMSGAYFNTFEGINKVGKWNLVVNIYKEFHTYEILVYGDKGIFYGTFAIECYHLNNLKENETMFRPSISFRAIIEKTTKGADGYNVEKELETDLIPFNFKSDYFTITLNKMVKCIEKTYKPIIDFLNK